ncbi:hypothetical protein [Nocardia sp. NPDC050793]|uniref:hypothetical protein n=1 Tax=Nocardia sp. NPDC050793 TaxID=3155159 RepID=UPI0033FBA60E
MADNWIEPREVIELVERYVSEELADAERYDNRTPLDRSGVWSLHQLARDIYAHGVKDGTMQEQMRNVHARERAAEAVRDGAR